MTETFYQHGLRRMRGRDITEAIRAASPLELLFDLVFATAFGVLGTQLAESIIAGHPIAAFGGFAFGGFAIVWAWINYSWFASAFDTDDWLFRVFTMVQMSGVIVLAIGLPATFESLAEGDTLDCRVIVIGYIVMRVGLIAQWARAARSSEHQRAARMYMLMIALAQLGWVVVGFAGLDIVGVVIGAAVCWTIELAGPVLAERRGGESGSTPWHPHHIAERYACMAIITLGETVVGTIGAAQEISVAQGWSFDAIIEIAAGVAMTFALWWSYFLMPSGHALEVHRGRAFVWGYAHAFVFLSIAAVGAGLHLIGSAYTEGHALAPLVVISVLAGAVIAFIVSVFGMDWWLLRGLWNLIPVQAAAAALTASSIVAVALGAPLWAGVLLALAGPVGLVIWYESGGWRLSEAHYGRGIAQAQGSRA